jgi:hypothetical protein
MKAWRQRANQQRFLKDVLATGAKVAPWMRMGRALKVSQRERFKPVPSPLFFRLMMHAGWMQEA